MYSSFNQGWFYQQWMNQQDRLPLIVILPSYQLFQLFQRAFPDLEPMIWSGGDGTNIRGYHARGAIWCHHSFKMKNFEDIVQVAKAACSPHVADFTHKRIPVWR